ncbi:MAG: ABC transporter ATP-binding protein [Oscillospiraceae bacterium]|nr:ABC transporter ATP-binding protein [Oscillospiraceae bacterium]
MSCVVLKDISKSFGPKTVFSHFNLTVSEGEFVALVGPSGCGKTTLLNMIGLLEKPESGDIVISGVKNPRLASKEGRQLLRTQISYMFQNYGLVERMSVSDNLRIATRFLKLRKKEERQKIEEVLDRVGLEGYEKTKIFQLSGGEQQRVAVAKIMLKPSRLILADEPTGSLDPKNRDHIMSLLKQFNQEGKTVIVVTHDPEVVKCAQRSEKL